MRKGDDLQIEEVKAQAARAKAQLDALDAEIAEDPANIAPSHCSCNRSRGNKDIDEKSRLGISSENWLTF